MKRGIGGVYHSVSQKHLQGYLNEYAWRYNFRDEEGPAQSYYCSSELPPSARLADTSPGPSTSGPGWDVLAAFRRSANTSSRRGTGISCPCGVHCVS